MKGFGVIMSQQFAKVKPNLNGSMRKRIPLGIAHAILTGDCQSAMDVLRLVDCDILFGEMQMSDRNSVAQFYGVQDSYVYSVMSRYGLTSTSAPEYVRNLSVAAYCDLNGISYKDGAGHLPDGRKFGSGRGANPTTWYDARSILAFSCLAFISRKVIPDSNADRILRALGKTRYYDTAKREIEAHDAEIVPIVGQAQEVQDTHEEMQPVVAGMLSQIQESHPPIDGGAYIPVSVIPEIIKVIMPYLRREA